MLKPKELKNKNKIVITTFLMHTPPTTPSPNLLFKNCIPELFLTLTTFLTPIKINN